MLASGRVCTREGVYSWWWDLEWFVSPIRNLHMSALSFKKAYAPHVEARPPDQAGLVCLAGIVLARPRLIADERARTDTCPGIAAGVASTAHCDIQPLVNAVARLAE